MGVQWYGCTLLSDWITPWQHLGNLLKSPKHVRIPLLLLHPFPSSSPYPTPAAAAFPADCFSRGLGRIRDLTPSPPISTATTVIVPAEPSPLKAQLEQEGGALKLPLPQDSGKSNSSKVGGGREEKGMCI